MEISHFEDKIPCFVSTYNFPGLSVAVVKDGHPILTKGYGIKDLTTRAPVTESTGFAIGSLTKAFTSTMLAAVMSTYKGRVTWDTPLRELFGSEWPGFSDPWRTRDACLRDLLAHKLGVELGESDFGWLCDGLSRADIVQNSEHLPFAAQFRTKLMYNNFLYALAASAAEKLTSQTWEELVKTMILDVIGMRETFFLNEEGIDSKEVATPYMSAKGVLTPIDTEVHRGIGFCGPAGSIVSSAKDMAKWLLFQLNGGCLDGVQVVDKDMMKECQKPQFALPLGKPEWSGYISKPFFPATETRDAYCFGWYTGTYREYRMVAHGGELFGYDSLITLFPEMNLGIYTAANGPSGEQSFIGHQLLHYIASDIFLGLDPWLSKDTIRTFPEPWRRRVDYFPERINTEVNKSIPPSRPLESYTGKFRHGFMGTVTVCVESGVLVLHYGRIGNFHLYPDGIQDEFRLEGQGNISFLHQLDLYSPSDWMMVNFSFASDSSVKSSSLCISLFESGPVFGFINE